MLEVAEQLMAEAEKQENPEGADVAQDGQAPAKAEDVKQEATVKTEADTKQTVQQARYWDRALQEARVFLKNEKLTQEELQEAIAKSYLSANKRIQKHAERANAYEKQVTDLGAYKKFYDDLMANPDIQALYAGKAKIVKELEQVEDQLMDDPTNKQLQAMQAKLDGFIAKLEGKEKQTIQSTQQQQAEKELTSRVNTEVKGLEDKYPLFKQWMDEKRQTNQTPLELEEIYDMMETDGMSLTGAVKVYLADKNLPNILEKNKQETIKGLKKKAGERSENASSSLKGQKARNMPKDNADLAEMLLEDAGIED